MAFTFNHNGSDHTIPSMDEVPMGVIRKSRKTANEMDAAFTILEEVMGEGSAALAALDEMQAPEFQAFLEAWTQGAPVGESVSSEN
jgi:hypothetical protein